VLLTLAGWTSRRIAEAFAVLFVASLQKLACNEKFKEIRIAKARTLGSYRYPNAKGTARETIEPGRGAYP
jgi:hypothetical protein